MGYTHFFSSTREITEEEWSRFLTFTRKAIRLSHVKIRGGLGEGPPTIEQGHISLNGDGADSAETFYIRRRGTDDFCKTYEKPYDIVVSACLTYLARHCDFDVGSDGLGYDYDYFDEGWAGGMSLCDLTEERLADENRKLAA